MRSDTGCATVREPAGEVPVTLSMYHASVPVFVRGLNNLTVLLNKGAAHAATGGMDPVLLINSRLAPDMFSLGRQVVIAADGARGSVARLAGIEPPASAAIDFAVFNRGDDYGFADAEKTFEALVARVEAVIAYLRGFGPEQFGGSEQRTITLTLRRDVRVFAGLPFLLNYALPNFYFHVTTVYAILRRCGVQLGKQDYQGTF